MICQLVTYLCAHPNAWPGRVPDRVLGLRGLGFKGSGFPLCMTVLVHIPMSQSQEQLEGVSKSGCPLNPRDMRVYIYIYNIHPCRDR